MTRVYVSNATLFIYDGSEPSQENAWTSRHATQGFARRPTTMNLRALAEEDGFIVDLERSFEALTTCTSITSFSLFTPSGRIELSGGEPGGDQVWAGRPGWVRVTIGQSLVPGTQPQEIRLVLTFEDAAGEEPTLVRTDGKEVEGDLLETAEPFVLPTA